MRKLKFTLAEKVEKKLKLPFPKFHLFEIEKKQIPCFRLFVEKIGKDCPFYYEDLEDILSDRCTIIKDLPPCNTSLEVSYSCPLLNGVSALVSLKLEKEKESK